MSLHDRNLDDEFDSATRKGAMGYFIHHIVGLQIFFCNFFFPAISFHEIFILCNSDGAACLWVDELVQEHGGACFGRDSANGPDSSFGNVAGSEARGG